MTKYLSQALIVVLLVVLKMPLWANSLPTATPTIDANGYFQNGLISLDRKEYDVAISAFTDVIRLKPDYANAYNNRGLAYDDLKQYEQAIADFTAAIGLKPDYPGAYNNRGIACGEL
jgi:tetratricopeptide (TPR) repeat protein